MAEISTDDTPPIGWEDPADRSVGAAGPMMPETTAATPPTVTVDASIVGITADSIRMAVGTGACSHATVGRDAALFGAGSTPVEQLDNLAEFGRALAERAEARKVEYGERLCEALVAATTVRWSAR